jgi:hypothetical protein
MNRKLSLLRTKLNDTHTQIQQLIQDFQARRPLLPGSLYTLKRRCGKPNCHCVDGQLHTSTVLSYRGEQKPRTISPPADQIDALENMTDDYRDFRKARAQLVRLQRKMLEHVDQIQTLRVQQGERDFRKIHSDSSHAHSRR